LLSGKQRLGLGPMAADHRLVPGFELADLAWVVAKLALGLR
jgi:hypothetical protein